MSLYREARSRPGRRIAALVAAATVGLLAGLAIGWALRPEPSLADGIEQVQDDVRPALDALELVPIHYESSSPVTRRAARDQLARAEDAFDDAEPDLGLLDPAGTATVARELAALERALASRVSAAQVERDATRTAADLRRVARLTRD
jgi:hypothetical protein